MRSEKIQMLEVVKGLLKDKSFFLIGFRAITVAEFSAFRSQLAEFGAQCHVVKNTLIHKAAEALGYQAVAEQNIVEATAVVSGSDDPVAMAKAIKEMIKATPDAEKKPRVTVKLGFLDGKLLDAADVAALADLPPREALLGQLLGVLQAPASGLVRVLNAKLSSILYVLNAFSEKKKEQAA